MILKSLTRFWYGNAIKNSCTISRESVYYSMEVSLQDYPVFGTKTIPSDIKIMDFTRVAEDDPNRCQGITANGQCQLGAIEGSKFCRMHCGRGAGKQERENMRNYRLAKWRQRTEDLSGNTSVHSLRDEVAILRVMVEERFNQCNNTHDLLMHSGPLSDLIVKIEKLVTSGHRLESRLGELLDRSTVLQFAQMIVEIIGGEIENEDQLERISDQILVALGEL